LHVEIAVDRHDQPTIGGESRIANATQAGVRRNWLLKCSEQQRDKHRQWRFGSGGANRRRQTMASRTLFCR
jgi:hypothetical protein